MVDEVVLVEEIVDVYVDEVVAVEVVVSGPWHSGLLSNQGEKSINFYFIRVPLRKKY